MRLLAAAAALIVVASSAAAPAKLPGATAFTACAGAGPYWPTETLAVDGSTAWVACKEQSRVVRFDMRNGKTTGSVALDGQPIAVLAAFGSIWALDGSGSLYRIDRTTGKLAEQVATRAITAYNLWAGAGSLWVVDDSTGEVVRIAPGGSHAVKTIEVGDGAADMVFAGTSAWVVNHRDRGLVHIDTRTNRATRITTLKAEVPERMALLGGNLWITGRGTDLLKVNPATGAIRGTYDVGASGIDVVAGGGALWVPSRSAAVDPTGFPTMEALRRVSTGGKVATVAKAGGRLDVHGLASDGKSLWLADNTSGALYRVPLR